MQTICSSCQVDAVCFNEFNVSVYCQACGAEEPDVDVRQSHLELWVRERYPTPKLTKGD